MPAPPHSPCPGSPTVLSLPRSRGRTVLERGLASGADWVELPERWLVGARQSRRKVTHVSTGKQAGAHAGLKHPQNQTVGVNVNKPSHPHYTVQTLIILDESEMPFAAGRARLSA
jgi:hypothetical protein